MSMIYLLESRNTYKEDMGKKLLNILIIIFMKNTYVTVLF